MLLSLFSAPDSPSFLPPTSALSSLLPTPNLCTLIPPQTPPLPASPRCSPLQNRRDRISQRMRTLYTLVPNTRQSDTATMLDEAIRYVRQLQEQVQVGR